MARTDRGRGGLHRAVGGTPLPRPVLIVCEGKTEQKALDALRQRWRVPHASVRVVGQAGDPKAVVDHAKRLAREEYTRSDRLVVVVVFDRDEHARWTAALQEAQDVGFVRAVSHPCVELWALLMHGDQRAALDRHAAQRALAAVHPRYRHDKHPFFDVPIMVDAWALAEERAQGLNQVAAENGDPFGNPSTYFHLAVRALMPPGSVA